MADHGVLIRQLQGAVGAQQFEAGTVSTAGAFVAGTGGWSASRSAVGRYTLTFSTAGVWIVVVTVTGTGTLPFLGAKTSTTVAVDVNDAGNTVAVDAQFDFIAARVA